MTTLTDVLVGHLATRDPEEPGVRARARRIAVDIENRFHMIPAAECEPVEGEYLLPNELVEDGTAVESVHAYQLNLLINEAERRGLLIISPTERHELPPNTPALARLGKRFLVRATGWRLPVPHKVAPRSGEQPPPPPPGSAGSGGGTNEGDAP